MFRVLIGAVLMIFLFLFVGSIVLEQFPSVQPLWEELKVHVVTLYNMSLVKYGMVSTLLLIIALVILTGSGKKM